ncbi:unnamed protein product [Caenorhabditis nigoni]
MSLRLVAVILLLCFVADVSTKYLAMIDQPDVVPDDVLEVEEERQMCFCCRAFVCRHQTCPCSRFTELF